MAKETKLHIEGPQLLGTIIQNLITGEM
jgi:hypothetical protein